MSKISDNPNQYYRAGVAIPITRKVILMERLRELNMHTIGDLVTTFAMAPGIVEAMKPIAVEYMTARQTKRALGSKRQELLKRLANMDPVETKRLFDLFDNEEAV